MKGDVRTMSGKTYRPMGGRVLGGIEARSDGLGRGSEFIARLPRPHQQAETPPATPPTAQCPDLPRDPRSVLIIEDNRDAATSMQMLLQLLGHEAWVAHTGQDALGLAAARRYDLIFLEVISKPV
jgi:PleD family two-component response regulator